ncbi:MAG: SMI1/KNR4 family protein [Clostridia bacterium]|nr:SMI1/KNR4 family protein [Clostridia bacterium]
MYKELILECSKDIKWTRIQSPATIAEIQKAENIVGYTFPDELRELLSELNGDSYLILSTDQIKENCLLNREYLKECYEDIDCHIFFAGNGCGDYYCYNVTDNGKADTSAIYIWEHETNETHFVATSIKELIIRYYNSEI